MKITLIADVYGKSNNAIIVSAQKLVENLRMCGHEVKVVSAYKNSDVVLEQRSICCFNKHKQEKNGVVLAKPDDKKLREAIAGSDVVHLLLPFKCSRRAIQICQELEVPYTTSFECQPENISSLFGFKTCTWFNNILYSKFLKKFYKNVHFIHCPSDSIADELTKRKYKAQKYVISTDNQTQMEQMFNDATMFYKEYYALTQKSTK